MIEIIINARKYEVPEGAISYEDLVRLVRFRLGPVYTMTYFRGLNGSQGSMTPGESVEAVAGMIFSLALTNSA